MYNETHSKQNKVWLIFLAIKFVVFENTEERRQEYV